MDWYPTPSYLVKRRAILESLSGCSGTEVLEVGCGCGDLLHELARRGYSGMGIDISREALAIAAPGLVNSPITVKCCSPEEIDGKYDVVIASEVLEHYQDDLCFLSGLKKLIRNDGHLILTVPAHMADWGANDDFCGHVRRYERIELQELMQKAGFREIVINSYGVPVYNIMKPFYDAAIGSKNVEAAQADKTSASGGMWLLKGKGKLFRMLFNDVTLFPMYLLQRLFYRTNLGKGYLVTARKKELL